MREADASDTPLWDAFVAPRAAVPFFYRKSWAHLLEAAGLGAPRLLMACQGSRVLGVYPLYHIDEYEGGTALASVPGAPLGGILADDPSVVALLQRHAVELSDQLSARRSVRTRAGNAVAASRFRWARVPIAAVPARDAGRIFSDRRSDRRRRLSRTLREQAQGPLAGMVYATAALAWIVDGCSTYLLDASASTSTASVSPWLERCRRQGLIDMWLPADLLDEEWLTRMVSIGAADGVVDADPGISG